VIFIIVQDHAAKNRELPAIAYCSAMAIHPERPSNPLSVLFSYVVHVVHALTARNACPGL
jgi:hypothetical protein